MIEEFEVWNMDHKGVPTKPTKQMLRTAKIALEKYRQETIQLRSITGDEQTYQTISEIGITVMWLEEMAKL